MPRFFGGIGLPIRGTHGPEATASPSPQTGLAQSLQSGDRGTGGASLPPAQASGRRPASARHPHPATSFGRSRLLSRLGVVADSPHRGTLEESALHLGRRRQRGDRAPAFP